MKITDISIRNLKAPARGAKIFYDDSLPGFGVRVSHAGTKSYVLTHGARRQRETIGRVGILSLFEARQEAKRRCAEYTLGKLRPVSVSWKTATAEFLEAKKAKLRPNTLSAYRHHLSLFPFGDTKLAEVAEQDLQDYLDKLSDRPAMQHNTFVVLRVFFRWAYRKNYIDRNPVDRMETTKPGLPRKRVLTDRELDKVLKTALQATTPYHSIVALLALTGQRRGEIAALQWSWIDFEQKTITIPETIAKNKEEHCFPIGQMALDVLTHRANRSPYVFPADRDRFKERPATTFNGWAKPKRAFDGELNIAPFVLHDLRRTLRTKWAEMGVLEEVAEKYINHISGRHGGLARTYNRAKYLEPMREAVAKWEDYLQTIIRA